jgi:hypothetical protein
MIKIRFFSPFCSQEDCINLYIKCSELNKDPLFGVKYCFVTNDEYTHAVILNNAMPPNLKIPKENVIGLALEPILFLGLTNEFIEYAKKHIGTYFIGEKLNILPEIFKEHQGYLWHNKPLDEKPIKNCIMSLILSYKKIANGHIYRHVLCDRILNSKLPIDIYGRGCEMYSYKKDSRIKGKFNEYEPYLNYLYHITIENFQTPHYFSEKITNSLLSGTVPIYLGCKNIENYFPKQVIHLTGNVDKDMKLLHEICMNPQLYKREINIDEVKKTVSFTELLKKVEWI